MQIHNQDTVTAQPAYIANLRNYFRHLSPECELIEPSDNKHTASYSLQELPALFITLYKVQHPKAGSAFYSSQVWQQILWQPVSLWVCANYYLNLHINIEQLRFSIKHHQIDKIIIPEKAISPLLTSQDKRRQIIDLKHSIDALLNSMTAQIRINQANALGLFADRLLTTLEKLSRFHQLAIYSENQWASPETVNFTRLGNLLLRELELTNGHGHPISCLQTKTGKTSHHPSYLLVTKSCCRVNKIAPLERCRHCPALG